MSNTSKSNRNLGTKQLKYTIKLRLASTLGEKKSLLEKIITECNVSKPTFYRWCNIRSASTESIPFDSMVIIAKHLKCELLELKTVG